MKKELLDWVGRRSKRRNGEFKRKKGLIWVHIIQEKL